jgi:hypothetical protein
MESLYDERMRIVRVFSALALAIGSTQSCYPQHNATDSQRLQEAVSKGHRLGAEASGVAAVAELLDLGLNVNAKDSVGWTALMMASLEGLPDVAETLLRRGANPNIRSDKGETALFIAAGCFIVRTKADLVKERGFDGDMRLRQLGAPQRIVKSLIRAGAAVDVATSDRRTPLMNASMLGWTDVVRVLINAGANVKVKDTRGRTAIDYANPSEISLVSLLRAAGSPEPSGRSGRTICDAQTALKALGIRSRHPDCLGGRDTETEVKTFQRQKGLPVSGELDNVTIKALNIRD